MKKVIYSVKLISIWLFSLFIIKDVRANAPAKINDRINVIRERIGNNISQSKEVKSNNHFSTDVFAQWNNWGNWANWNNWRNWNNWNNWANWGNWGNWANY